MSHVSHSKSTHVCHAPRAAPPAPPPHLQLMSSNIKQIKDELAARVGRQFETADRTRGIMHSKLDKLENNIDSLLAIRNSVSGLREDVLRAQAALLTLHNRAFKIEALMDKENYPNDILIDFA